MHAIHPKKITEHLKSKLPYKSCPRSRPNPEWHMQGAHWDNIQKVLKNELALEPPSWLWKARKNWSLNLTRLMPMKTRTVTTNQHSPKDFKRNKTLIIIFKMSRIQCKITQHTKKHENPTKISKEKAVNRCQL